MDTKIRATIAKIDIDRFKDNEDYKYYRLENDFLSFSKFVKTKLLNQGIKCDPYIGNDYHMFVYSRENEVDWKGFVENLVDSEYLHDKNFHTQHPSFIYLRKIDLYIFCITSGLGNNIISEFKDKLFGMDIITKIVDKDDRIIRRIADKRVYGRRNKLMIYNRRKSNFADEENFESIFNDIGTSLKKEIYEKLGIRPLMDVNNKETDREMIVNFGASISIGKNVEYGELNRILEKIKAYLDQKEYNFVINYLVSIQFMGFTQTEVRKEFISAIKNNPELIHFGYDASINSSLSKENIKNSNGNSIKDIIFTELNFNEINNVYDLKEFCTSFVKQYQQTCIIDSYSIEIANDYGQETYKIYDLLDLEFDYKGNIVYLVEGNWYIFLANYNTFLNNKYKEIYEKSEVICNSLFSKEKINLDVKSCGNENELKKLIQTHIQLIDGDMRYYSNVEVADAIYLDDNTIYFLHNKQKFSGEGMRDVTGQISASAGFINDLINKKFDSENKFNDYIDRLKTKNIGKELLVDNFKKQILENRDKRIVFIAVFTDDIILETNSSSIKFLIETTVTEIKQYDFQFYIH